MYALPALTLTIAEITRSQFTFDDEQVAESTHERVRTVHRVRAALAAALERAARALAPAGPSPVH